LTFEDTPLEEEQKRIAKFFWDEAPFSDTTFAVPQLVSNSKDQPKRHLRR
jgi:hypothetical protein